MTIEALVSGKLFGTAQRRTAGSGKAFVTAKVRASAGDGESLFLNVVCFSESAGAALLALGDGDAVALAGNLKPGAWTDRDGKPRPSLDMVAAQVLTLYGLKGRRTAAQAGDEPGEPAASRRPDAGARIQRQQAGDDNGMPPDWGPPPEDPPGDLPSIET